MKKSIVVVLSMILILLSAGPVLASEGGLDLSKSDNGGTVTYTLSLTPGSNIQAADYVLSYRDDALEFSGFSKGAVATADNTLIQVNPKTDEQKIYISFATLNDTASGGKIVSLDFRKTGDAGSNPVIGVDVQDQFNIDSADIRPVVTGDDSVAIVYAGKSVKDADSGAAAVQAGSETIPAEITTGSTAVSSQEGTLETTAGQSTREFDESGQTADIVGTAQSGNTGQPASGMVRGAALAAVCMFILVVVVFVHKKKKDSSD